MNIADGAFSGASMMPGPIPPTTDQMMPQLGPMLSMNTPLQATKVEIVHGDVIQQVLGSVNSLIAQNLLAKIMQDETLLVGENQTILVSGNKNSTVTGTYNGLHIGPRNDTHVSPHNRMNAAPDSQDDSSDKTRILGVVFEHTKTEHSLTNFKLEMVGMGIGLTAAQVDLTWNNVEGKMIDLAAVGGMSIEPKMTEVNLEPFHTFLEGADTKAAGLSAAVAPSVNAVPHIPMAGGN
jgi:hypothetical protein